MIPETSGTGNAELSEFTPSETAYTVYAGCSGAGTVTVVDRAGDGERHPVVCDGMRTVGVVHTPKEPQRLAVEVTGGISAWRLSVVAGSQQQ